MFTVDSDSVVLMPGDEIKTVLDCVTGPGGRAGGILLVSSVDIPELSDLRIDSQITRQIEVESGVFTEEVTVAVVNDGTLPEAFTLTCRCLDP